MIPAWAPAWTNHNASEPGITLIELFAYLSEMLLYRLNRVGDANVIEFPGEASYWVRIRPHGDDRAVAEKIMHRVRPSEGDAYLTRLD